MNDRRYLYGADDDRVIADINQGTIMLAILYGNNDYLQTLKIAAIGGNEGVDNATPIGGLMGIIKGMAGTPQAFLDKIYANGAGVFVNDNSGALVTYVKTNYPAEQKLTDIASLYQSNFEQLLAARGGTSTTSSYRIPTETLQRPVTITPVNAGFEDGTLNGWSAVPASNGKAESQVGSANSFAHYTLSHSGNWKGTIFTDSTNHDVTLSQNVSGLTIGATYDVRAFAASETGADAAIYVANGTSSLRAAVYSSEDMGPATTTTLGRTWARRDIEFTATSANVTIGLQLHSDPGTSAWANIDDLSLRQITAPPTTTYEAENATLSGGATVATASTASGGKYVTGLGTVGASATFTVQAPTAGEYRFAVSYANPSTPDTFTVGTSTSWPLPSHLALSINGSATGNVFFPRTGHAGQFSANLLAIPVDLNAGTNTISLGRADGTGAIDLDVATLSTFPVSVTSTVAGAAPSPVPVTNSGFEADGPTQTPTGWNTWPGSNGTDADADYVETGGHSGTYRLTHYKASAYEVYTAQTLTGLTDGYYTISAWVVGSGGQTAAYMDAKDYGGPALQANLPQSGWPNWTLVTIPNVAVVGGNLTFGFYSKANPGNWLSVDDIRITRSQ